MSGTMDPERLAWLRAAQNQADAHGDSFALSVGESRDLLADRDHWEAEAKRLESLRAKLGRMVEKMMAQRNEAIAEAQRWRARCPVTAEDVSALDPVQDEEQGVLAARWVAYISALWGAWERSKYQWRAEDTLLMQGDSYEALARSANWVAAHLSRPPHDILAEMAAEVSP